MAHRHAPQLLSFRLPACTQHESVCSTAPAPRRQIASRQARRTHRIRTLSTHDLQLLISEGMQFMILAQLNSRYSVFQCAEHCRSTHDPELLRLVCRDLKHENEVGRMPCRRQGASPERNEMSDTRAAPES